MNDLEEFKAALYRAISERKGAKFLPENWVEGQLYDCVTFCASVYNALGITEIEAGTWGDYAVFSRGSSMLQRTIEGIEGTGAFTALGSGAEVQMGDLILFSTGERGHHTAIALDDVEGRTVAHCVKGRGVVIDSYISPLSDHVWQVYRPNLIIALV